MDCPAGHPERLLGQPSFLVGRDTRKVSRRPVRHAWLHDGRLVLHFEGVHSIETAQDLQGAFLFLEETELPSLPAGSYYTFELVGASLVNGDGRVLGQVIDTESGPQQDRLVVRVRDGRELDVPMSGAIVRHIDLDAGTIQVDAPDGLLEGEAETVLPSPADERGGD